MAKQLFANGASAELAVSVADTDVSVQVQAGYGALFPSPSAGNWFLITLEDNNANVEVCKCTARSGDLLTVTRAQEGTSAQSFTNTVTRVELRNTKGTMENLLQRTGDSLTGNLDLGGFALENGSLGTDVTIPAESVFPVGMIVMWSGSIGSIPAKWALCNGSNGTPDLRNRFVVGAGSTYSVGGTGGATTDTATTASDGAHDHGGVTGGHALTEAELAAHNHRIYGTNNASNSNADGWLNTSNMSVPGEDVGPHAYRDTNTGGTEIIENTGSGSEHTHPIASGGAHTHSVVVDTVPPYYALAYIMFTG